MISKERLSQRAIEIANNMQCYNKQEDCGGTHEWFEFNVAELKFFAHALLKAVEAESEVELYRYKHEDDSGWKPVEPRNPYMNTVYDTVNELETYIHNGYKYKIQKLIALPLVEGDM